MSRKTVLLTFDYELFLGKKSGSCEKCMLEPTYLLLDLLGKYHKKAIFFIDTTYLFRLNEISDRYPAAAEDLEKIKKQIQDIFNRGHYVFHHLHPHWLDAVYIPELNEWDLSDKKRFSFANITTQEKEKIFHFSDALLQELRSATNSTLPVNGYRAGGLYLQPFEEIRPFFEKYHIQYDFSVHPGFKSVNEGYGFDYTGAPLKSFYTFNDDPSKESAGGKYYEFPIDHLTIPLPEKIIHAVYYRTRVKGNKMGERIGDGKSSGNTIRGGGATVSKFSATRETFSVEQLNNYKTKLYKKHLYTTGHLHIISHPKLISRLNVHAFEKLLAGLDRDKNIVFDFMEMIQ